MPFIWISKKDKELFELAKSFKKFKDFYLDTFNETTGCLTTIGNICLDWSKTKDQRKAVEAMTEITKELLNTLKKIKWYMFKGMGYDEYYQLLEKIKESLFVKRNNQ